MVSGAAPLVESESASVATVIDRNFVDNMPLNGRSYIDLLGVNNIIIEAKEAVDRNELQSRRAISPGLTFRDFRAIAENVQGVEALTPRKRFKPLKVLPKTASETPLLIGVEPNYVGINSLKVVEGRFFNDDDDARSAPVCVLGESAKVNSAANCRRVRATTSDASSVSGTHSAAIDAVLLAHRVRLVADPLPGAGGLLGGAGARLGQPAVEVHRLLHGVDHRPALGGVVERHPGRDHAAAGDKKKIVSIRTADICGRCHLGSDSQNQGSSVPAGMSWVLATG